MVVKFFTFEQFHNKKDVGSTKIRVHNLIRHWPEASLYQFGDKMDVMIFQKVYCTYDYKYPKHLKAIKILDACDIDWYETPDIYLKETLNNMNGVVVPTEPLRRYLQQMTEARVKVIKDRFDLSEFPPPKKQQGKAKTVVWFGYAHNAELLKSAIPALEKRNLKLIVVSNHDPVVDKWATVEAFKKSYQFIRWNEKAYQNIQTGDICILPKGVRPMDKFKSENKTTIARLLGLPVATNAEELDQFLSPESRVKDQQTWYNKTRTDYDVKLSVKEYKELIDELQETQ